VRSSGTLDARAYGVPDRIPTSTKSLDLWHPGLSRPGHPVGARPQTRHDREAHAHAGEGRSVEGRGRGRRAARRSAEI